MAAVQTLVLSLLVGDGLHPAGVSLGPSRSPCRSLSQSSRRLPSAPGPAFLPRLPLLSSRATAPAKLLRFHHSPAKQTDPEVPLCLSLSLCCLVFLE